MTARKAATATAGVAGSVGGIAALVASPLPVIVIGIIILVALVPLVVIVLTPVISQDPGRCMRATAVLDRLLATLPGRRSSPPVVAQALLAADGVEIIAADPLPDAVTPALVSRVSPTT